MRCLDEVQGLGQQFQPYRDIASEFVALYLTWDTWHSSPVISYQQRHQAAHSFCEPPWGGGPTCLEEKLEWARCWQTPQRVIHYQVGSCIGGNICFRSDSRLTGAVVYRKVMVKQILYTSDCTKKFFKITVVFMTAYQVTVHKSIYTVSCKMKNFHDFLQCRSAWKMTFHKQIIL